MIFHCTKLCLCNSSGSWVVSIKQNVNFKFQPPTVFVLLVSRKSDLLKVVHPLKIYQNKKFHGPMLTGEHFAHISKV
jgi:hypothetical protein